MPNNQTSDKIHGNRSDPVGYMREVKVGLLLEMCMLLIQSISHLLLDFYQYRLILSLYFSSSASLSAQVECWGCMGVESSKHCSHLSEQQLILLVKEKKTMKF